MQDSEYRIALNGRWELTDLSEFSRVYTQVYSFFYVVDERFEDLLQIDLTMFSVHPWRGGYSAVNFYRSLWQFVRRDDRPTVKQIRYSSPGFIELGLVVSTAVGVKIAVSNLLDVARKVSDTYHEIYRSMQERKLLRIDVLRHERAFAEETIQFCEQARDRLGNAMGLEDVGRLDGLTGSPLGTLKILLSLYRRLRVLADLHEDGKLEL